MRYELDCRQRKRARATVALYLAESEVQWLVVGAFSGDGAARALRESVAAAYDLAPRVSTLLHIFEEVANAC